MDWIKLPLVHQTNHLIQWLTKSVLSKTDVFQCDTHCTLFRNSSFSEKCDDNSHQWGFKALLVGRFFHSVVLVGPECLGVPLDRRLIGIGEWGNQGAIDQFGAVSRCLLMDFSIFCRHCVRSLNSVNWCLSRLFRSIVSVFVPQVWCPVGKLRIGEVWHCFPCQTSLRLACPIYLIRSSYFEFIVHSPLEIFPAWTGSLLTWCGWFPRMWGGQDRLFQLFAKGESIWGYFV